LHFSQEDVFSFRSQNLLPLEQSQVNLTPKEAPLCANLQSYMQGNLNKANAHPRITKTSIPQRAKAGKPIYFEFASRQVVYERRQTQR
jgi:hypothetical protein